MEHCYSCVPVVYSADSPEAVLVFSDQVLNSINDKFSNVKKNTINKRNFKSIFSACFVSFGTVSVTLYVD